MAIPACLELPDIPTAQEIILPGGISIASLHAEINRIPTLCSTTLNLTSQLQPALAPLKPFFDLLDTVIQIFKCVKAVPESILQLNPFPLLQCLPELAQKIDQLLRLIPQLSIPHMIVSILNNLIALLNCIVGVVENLLAQTVAIARRIEQAADIGDPKLDAILECAQDDVAVLQQNAAEALAGVGTLIGLVNIFLTLIGADEIPDFSEALQDVPLDEMLQPIQDIIRVLETIRDAIPLPSLPSP